MFRDAVKAELRDSQHFGEADNVHVAYIFYPRLRYLRKGGGVAVRSVNAFFVVELFGLAVAEVFDDGKRDVRL